MPLDVSADQVDGGISGLLGVDMSKALEPNDITLAHELVERDFRLMEHWDEGEAAAIIAPTMYNDESLAEPPAARQPGVAGARATYDWLHTAYTDLRWVIHRIVAEDDWVAAHTTMSGRQHGPFSTFTADGAVGQVFPPTGRTFEVSQTHWFRIADGQLVEHRADRDDLAQALQLGWFGPPRDSD